MWLRRIASRRATSIVAVAIWPVVIVPSVTRATWRRRFGSAYVVSSTSARPVSVEMVPVSPTWPPDSA